MPLQDHMCFYRIICVFTVSYVHVTGSSVTGSSVTGSNVLYMEFDPLHCYSDLQLCHSFVSACARILFVHLWLPPERSRKSGSRVLTSHTGKVYCIEELGIILLFFTFVR